MTTPEHDDSVHPPRETPGGRVEAQVDALHTRWEEMRSSIGDLSRASAEAWHAVEPDVRRLLSEMRDVLDRAGDRFREARVRTPDEPPVAVIPSPGATSAAAGTPDAMPRGPDEG